MIRYFLLANLYALLFYGLYVALLRNRTNHGWSRFYLLAATLLSLALPFIRLDWTIAQQVSGIAPLQIITLPEVVPDPGASLFFPNAQNLLYYAGILYIAGVYCFLARFIYRLIGLRLFLRRHRFEQHKGYRLALNTGIGPASFGAAIVFPGPEADPYILEHEKAHVRQHHQYDRLFLELLRCFFFPVMMLHFIYKELVQVQEFEADKIAATDRKSYAYTLLSAHLDIKNPYLLQSFFHHPLKRRIMMLQPGKRSTNNLTKSLLLFSAIALSGTIVFAQGKSGDAKVHPATDSDRKVFTMVDKVPEFPGGQSALMNYLAGSIKYPESAKKTGTEGRVIARFVVGREGRIKDIEIVRGLQADCDREVMRVLEAMPLWIPGEQGGQRVNVYYTLPVSFKLQEDKPKQQ